MGTAGTRPRDMRSVLFTYAFPLIVFGLVAYSGAPPIVAGEGLVMLPWTIAGVGGVAGTLGILAAARYLRGGAAPEGVEPTRLSRATVAVRACRIFMIAVAVVVGVAGVYLAPTGMDHNFAIGVNVGIAVALALFALSAPDIGVVRAPGRATRRVPG